MKNTNSTSTHHFPHFFSLLRQIFFAFFVRVQRTDVTLEAVVPPNSHEKVHPPPALLLAEVLLLPPHPQPLFVGRRHQLAQLLQELLVPLKQVLRKLEAEKVAQYRVQVNGLGAETLALQLYLVRHPPQLFPGDLLQHILLLGRFGLILYLGGFSLSF